MMPDIKNIQVGDCLPERRHAPTNVSLFLYNAAIWNAHRIHYDAGYTTEVEKHPAIVVDGPLQGDWLTQAVVNWLGDDGDLIEVEYFEPAGKLPRRNADLQRKDRGGQACRPRAGNLGVRQVGDEIMTPGRATVRFRR